MNATEAGTQQQTVNVLDDDTAQVLLSVNTGSLNEASGTAVFTIYTSGNIIVSTGIVVTLSYSGTAINGTDYVTGTTSVTIASLTTGNTFTLTGLNDLLVESIETIIVDIS